MRLQKYLSMCGIASRRKSEQIIKSGLIKINNEIINTLGVKINPDKDIIFYRDKKIEPQKNIYLMLNKPVGYITTMHDEFNRPNVSQLININQKIFPVGRLDFNTSGLLLFTNDGDLAYKLAHPKHNINKVYIAKIKGQIKNYDLDKFRNGIVIDNKKTAPAEINIISQNRFFSVVNIKIHEGRNRQIRKMCEAIRHPVVNLKRIAIGNLSLDINPGQFRYLNQKEVAYLKSI